MDEGTQGHRSKPGPERGNLPAPYSYPGDAEPTIPMQRDSLMRYDPLPDSVYSAPTQTSFTARPFTLRRSAFLFVGALLLVALTYVVVEIIFHGDWSDGARAAGIMALLLAGITAIVAMTRFVRGRRAPTMVILSLGMLAVLLITGIASLSQVNGLHLAQARSFERSGEYGGAIQEYALYGESAPNSVDIARTYIEWGNAYLKEHQYRDAAARFAIVASQYDKSGQSYAQARQELYQTYAAWLKSGQPVPYVDAINALASYRTDPACDPACQSAVGVIEAQARYLYGAQLVAAHQYTAAITQFSSVQQLFPQSPYAAKSYQGAAQAYWAVGQSQLTTSCPSAVPTYQTLVKTYANTDEGKKAKSALAAPQTVTGIVIHAPGNPLPTIYLATTLNPSSSNFSFSKTYTTTLDAKTGGFTFKNVKPGTYYFVTARNLGTQIEYTYLKYSDGGKPAQITVGPLCPVNIGSYNY